MEKRYTITSENGDTLSNMTVEELKQHGVSPSEIDTLIRAEISREKVALVRSNISKNVGDTASILGTTSDATGILIAIALADIVALSNGTNFTNYKEIKMTALAGLVGDTDIATVAQTALAQLASGEVKLTASLKGIEGVLTEALGRSTAVTEILTAVASEE